MQNELESHHNGIGIDPELFGRTVRKIRAIRGLTLKELASRMGLSEAFLSMVEKGKRNLSTGPVNKLSQALGIERWLMELLATPDSKRDDPVSKFARETRPKVWSMICQE